MQTVLIVAMSNISRDGRVSRHIGALKETYRVATIGFGPPPLGVVQHVTLPEKLKYLPLNLSALIPHLLRRFERSSQNTAAIRYVRDQLRGLKFDLVILNDVQTLPLMNGLSHPVIVDMHEYAPREMDDDWRFRLFLMAYYRWLCSKYLPLASAVTTVSDSLAKAFSQEFGVETTVILNAREFLDISIRETTSPQLRLIHTGLAARGRELEVMIDAVADLPNMSLDLFLVAAPRQRRTLRQLELRAARTPNVRIHSPIESNQISVLINRYDLSLVYLSPKGFSVRHSMPNKLFDSIQARVGIICGPSPDIVSFCKEYGVGVNTKEFSSQSLRLLLMALSVDVINGFKRACEEAAKTVNAKNEATKLQSVIQDCLILSE